MGYRLGLAVLAAVALGGVAEQAAAKPKSFVFAKINGQKLKVTGKGKTTDKCLTGNYSASSGVFTFGGLECRHGRTPPRGLVQFVGFACTISPFGQPTPCAVASYTEFTFKRYRLLSEKDWVATIGFDGPNITSTISVTLDSFDGTILRGRFSGVYDSQTGNPPAAVDGEGTFAVPMKVQ
jgi:hypothetical protein